MAKADCELISSAPLCVFSAREGWIFYAPRHDGFEIFTLPEETLPDQRGADPNYD